MKIYTKTGDKGQTTLFGGERVSKAQERIDAYGLVDQLNAQLDHFPNPEQIAEQIGKQLQVMIQEHPDMFRWDNKADYLKYLCQVCSKTWLVLRETAWEAIEQIEDLAQLKSLFALSLVESRSGEFTRFRIYLLEHQELWPYLAGQS